MAGSSKANAQLVRYVYFDVVGFTHGRSVEAQADIVSAFNVLVWDSLKEQNLKDEDTILLPTGDGGCIAVVDPDAPYDIHMLLALSLLKGVSEQAASEGDEMRKFGIRLGINENVDNIVDDLNTRENVAGAGVSIARRVMDFADSGQLLVGPTVYETLRHRETYMEMFRAFSGLMKHGTYLNVYQYVAADTPGLSTEVPAQFATTAAQERRLSEFEAYYFAHSLRNREFFMQKRSLTGDEYVGIDLLWLLAADSMKAAHAPEAAVWSPKTHGGLDGPIEDAYAHYAAIDFWVRIGLAGFISGELRTLADYFEIDGSQRLYHLVNSAGEDKLKTEYLSVWESLCRS